MDGGRREQGFGISEEDRTARLKAIKEQKKKVEEEKKRLQQEFRADRGSLPSASCQLIPLTTLLVPRL